MASARPATIKDVASTAGVSVSTVSRVMNGNATVDPSIADRVRETALELGYRASPVARSLVLGQTATVAMLVPDLGNPAFHSILRGVSRAAAAEGFGVLVADSGESAEAELTLALDLRRRCDALILCAPRMDDEQLRLLLDVARPVVVINRDTAAVAAPFVSVDYETGIRQIAQHLHGLGHRRIVYLAGNPLSSSNDQRVRGIEAFLTEHPDTTITSIGGGVSYEHGHAAADVVLDSGATAVMAFNDIVATGLQAELQDRGIRVPDDISVTGFDGTAVARYTHPRLTTAFAPTEELGELAWQRVIALLRDSAPDDDVKLLPRLAAGGSTGPAKDGQSGSS